MQYQKNTPYSSQSLYLDTQNADYNNGLYTFNLDTPIIKPFDTKFVFSVKEIEIVNVFPNIRNDINNSIRIIGTITGERINQIPEGYYNVEQFKLWFQSVFSGIFVSYSSTTCKLTFRSTTEDFSMECTGDYLGLNGVQHSQLGILIPEYVMDFSPMDYVFIKSNLVLKNVNNLGLTSSTLVRVPLSMPFAYTILYHPNEPCQHLSHEDSLNTIQLSVTDKQSRILSLQKTNLQVTIEIGYIYPEKPRLFIDRFQRGLHPFEQDIKTEEEILDNK